MNDTDAQEERSPLRIRELETLLFVGVIVVWLAHMLLNDFFSMLAFFFIATRAVFLLTIKPESRLD